MNNSINKVYTQREKQVGNYISTYTDKSNKGEETSLNNNNNNNNNPVPVLENDSYKLLWDFNIQTDHLIAARRPDLIIISKKKENMQNC